MLPEKWAIKITEENIETVGALYNKCIGSDNCYTYKNNIGNYLYSKNAKGEKFSLEAKRLGGSFRYSTLGNCIEISFEEFKKEFLSQEQETYEIY